MENIFKHLGINASNGLFKTNDRNQWPTSLPIRIVDFLLSVYSPYAFYCIENKPIMFFYNNNTPKKIKKIFKAIWNFNDIPIIFVINENTIDIYNGFKLLKNMNLDRIKSLDITELDKSSFSFESLLTGEIWDFYDSNKNNSTKVDYKLLMNIKFAKKIMMNYCSDINLINKLIGKLIFIRYLIDRQVKIKFDDYNQLTNQDFAEILCSKSKFISLIKYLQDTFNGDLFELKESELNFNSDLLDIMRELTLGSTFTDSKYIQQSLFDVYDFSIIPVEFISNVYEMFIGKKNQSANGAYYTPSFLVDYILAETIDKYYKDNPNEFNCIVLDPACGSGIFLVETLRKIVSQYEKLNPENSIKDNNTVLTNLVHENIFGIDKDNDAINVAIFSLYLTMLNYKEPADIENFRFPALKDKNFFCYDFFNDDLIKELSIINFNFIIGNPPWKRGKRNDDNGMYINYVNKRKQKEAIDSSKHLIAQKEICQAFILRTSDFSNLKTKCALVVNSKTLYNITGKDFREFFLNHYKVNKIIELSTIRKEIFNSLNKKAIAPCSILFYEYSRNASLEKNKIEYISIKPSKFFTLNKYFLISKNDYKIVLQNKLLENDFLWKTLVFGSYIDYNLIKKLKDMGSTVKSIIKKNNMDIQQGIKLSDGVKSHDLSDLRSLRIIKTEDLEPFISPDENSTELNTISVGYVPHKKNWYIPPLLLINQGLNEQFKHRATLSRKEILYSSTITAINAQNNQIYLLKQLCALFNSSFISYYLMMTGSSVGIERDRSLLKEKEDIPFIQNENLELLVDKIMELKKKKILSYHDDERCNDILNKIDEEIYKNFKLTEEEEASIDYALTMTMPLIRGIKSFESSVLGNLSQSKIENTEFIKKYIDVFIKIFNNYLKYNQLRLKAKVFINRAVIAILFSETDLSSNDETIAFHNEKDLTLLLTKFLELGAQNISKQLIQQKDIRGFESDGFYIIKSNQKNLWHRALAYIDVNEFIDSILCEDEIKYEE